MTNEIRQQKQSEGKRMYVKGQTIEFIAIALEVSDKTINKWRKQYEWDEARNVNRVSIDDLSAEILQALYDMKEGNELKIDPDKVSKLVAAYKKLNDLRSTIPYNISAYNLATEEMYEQARKLQGNDKQQYIDTVLKPMRILFEKIIDAQYQKMNSDE